MDTVKKLVTKVKKLSIPIKILISLLVGVVIFAVLVFTGVVDAPFVASLSGSSLNEPSQEYTPDAASESRPPAVPSPVTPPPPVISAPKPPKSPGAIHPIPSPVPTGTPNHPTSTQSTRSNDYEYTYEISNVGKTLWRPQVRLRLYSDIACTNKIEYSVRVKSPSKTGFPYDPNVDPGWRPDCHPCEPGQVKIQVKTNVPAKCIQVGNLGAGSVGIHDWSGGVRVTTSDGSRFQNYFDPNTLLDFNTLPEFTKVHDVGYCDKGYYTGHGVKTTLNECKMRCIQEKRCKYFHWQNGPVYNSCSLYSVVAGKCNKSTDTGTVGGTYKKPQWAVSNTKYNNVYDCRGGQIGDTVQRWPAREKFHKSVVIASVNKNSRSSCEAFCNSIASCAGFDYTTNNRGDSCRIVTGGTIRRTSRGLDNRTFCFRNQDFK